MPGALSPVAVDAVELHWVSLPLVSPWNTVHGSFEVREVILVHVVGPHTDGWGECSALPYEGYAGGSIHHARRALHDDLAPRLVETSPIDPLSPPGSDVPPTARFAIESALLDAALRERGTALAAYLGGSRDTVPAGVALAFGDTAATAARAGAAAEEGYRRVKCKIVPGRDLAVVDAVRPNLGTNVFLGADANGAYSAIDPTHQTALEDLDDRGLDYLEQPVADDDLDGLADLNARLRTPVALDETATSLESTREALDAHAGSAVSVKGPRVGGVLRAVGIHDLCASRGVPVLAGGMLETGVGRAAAVALASLPGFTHPGDLAASDHYFPEDLTEPFELVDGHLRVPAGSGLGVTPLPEMLRRYTLSVDTVTR